MGIAQAYIIQDKGTIMVDCGCPKKKKCFIKYLKRFSINPEDISLIIITHGHWDHTGSAKEIKEITGAKIAMHVNEKDWLEKSLKHLPPGTTFWGRFMATAMSLYRPFINVPATEVDMPISDNEFPLSEFGINGKVIYTPGHSSGSVSVLLDTGDIFVGDMAMATFPLMISPGLPDFAEDMDLLKESWRSLLDMGIKKIHPAHGRPFSPEIIRDLL